MKQKEIENFNIEKTRRKSERLNSNQKIKNQKDDSNLEEDSDYLELANCTTQKKVTIDDFNLVKLVGKGSFGKVTFDSSLF